VIDSGFDWEEDLDVWEVDIPDVQHDGCWYRHYTNVVAGSKSDNYFSQLASGELKGEVLVTDSAVMTNGTSLPGYRAVYFLAEQWQEIVDRVNRERRVAFSGPPLPPLP